MLQLDGKRIGFRHPAPSVGQHDGEVGTSWTDELAMPTGKASPPGLPLAKLRVVDFGHGGVGVEAASMLAQYGAEVIKVENRSYPDFIRLVSGSEMSPSFASTSRSKQSFGINIKMPEGLELIKELIRNSDVVIENNSTGTMTELGLGYESLRTVNPRIVMISSQLMGSTGPWSGWLGYGPSTRTAGRNDLALELPRRRPAARSSGHLPRPSGRAARRGFGPGRPGPPGAHRAGCPLRSGAGRNRSRTMSQYFLKESLEPGSVQPLGNRRPQGAPWGVYQCSGDERWCVITCRNDDDWANLREALGDPDWARSHELSTASGRREHHDEIDRQLSEWTARRSDRDVMQVLQSFGVPAGMMTYASDQPSDPHLRARGYLAAIDQPGVGPMILEGPAFHGSAMDRPVITPAPALGEHTRPIARQLLGLADEQIDALIAAGVLEVP